jgi:adenosine deaminase
MSSVDEALERLPKVELHCHIEGTMRPATVVDMARANGVELPTEDVTLLYRYGSLDEFLTIFWLVQSVLQSPADWARLAYESVVDAAEHGRVYAETRGADRVLGVGLDSTEIGVDPTSFQAPYAAAGRAGLRLTAHQGEVTGPAAIADCLDVLGVQRIDHGLSLMEDPALTARVAAERIPLTVCPNSNVRIANAVPRLADHPYPAMRHAGILATLNTDDPALTDLDIGYEYRSVAEAFGWGFDDMVTISLDGIEASWLPDDDKRALRNEVLAAVAGLNPR